MKSNNAIERRKAFLNFLLFFIITVGIIIITVFFSVQVPFKDNEKLRKEISVSENEKAFLQSFEMKMSETMNLLDSLTRAANVYVVQKELDTKIKAMTNMLNDSVSVKSMCNKIIDNLTNLRVAKEQLRNVSNNSAEMENKDKKIEQLEGDAKACATRVQELYLRLAGK